MDSRYQSFSAGVKGGPVGSSSVMANSMKFNSANPGRYHVSSVLDVGHAVPSKSGYSDRDYTRITPSGELPSSNGMSPGDYSLINSTQFPTHIKF